MKVFAKKATVLKYLKPHQILGNDNIKKYFILNDYGAFAELITSSKSPCYYEFIPENAWVNLFMDIEIYQDKQPEAFEQHVTIISEILTTIRNTFEPFNLQIIVLQSHSAIKRSYHVIVRLHNDEGPYYFKGVKNLKRVMTKLFPQWTNAKVIDTSVYREGLFRTFSSSKANEERPLVRDQLSDDFELLETFVCNCPNANESKIFLPEQITFHNTNNREIYQMDCNDNNNDSGNDNENVNDQDIEIIEPIQKDLTTRDQDIIKKFVRKNYKYRNADLRDVFIDRQLNCIIVALNDTFCHNIDREHRSNHQYIVIDTYSSKQKCHDTDCREYKLNEIKINQFPKEINEIILKCLKVNRQEQELIEKAIDDCKDYITSNFDETIDEIQFDRAETVFKGNASDNNSLITLNGKCANCRLEHRITNDGYCLKCKVCNSIYPKNQLIPLDD
jgi:hypothetical protein